MCVRILIGEGADGIECDNHGELVNALGGAPVYDARVDTSDLTEGDCLCGIDPAATAHKFGYRVADCRSDWGEIVLVRNLH